MKNYIHDETLYIYQERYGNGIEIDDTPKFFDGMPGAKDHIVRADCARPEIISHMKKHGYPKVTAVKKWDGSVEDGISKLRSFKEIVIHVQCKNAIFEAKMWKYKRDRLTDDVLPVLIDKHNHCWDANRYSIEPLIKRKNRWNA